jgi:hypothetical protein
MMRAADAAVYSRAVKFSLMAEIGKFGTIVPRTNPG